MGARAKGRKKHGTAGQLDRTLTTAEQRAQAWEQRHRLAQQEHESRQRAQGAFRRNTKVDAMMQQLLSTTEDPRGAVGLAKTYPTRSQWVEQLRYAGTPQYDRLTDEWIDHLERVMRGWTLEPTTLGNGHGTDAAPTAAPDATGGLGDVDTGALNRARARLLQEEPTLSFVFEACAMARQSQADVGRRLGVTQQHTSRLMYRAIGQIREWMASEAEADRVGT